MAITTIAKPQDLTPAFNPMYFYFNSTNKTQLGFRYLISILNATTSEVLGTYRLKPIPVSLYGEVDISKVLQSELRNYFQLSPAYVSETHLIKYKMSIDEEYFINYDFSNYSFAGDINWPNSTNPIYNPNNFKRTMLAMTGIPTYPIGSVIKIKQTPSGNFRPELEGIHTILDIFLDGGIYYVVLDLLWIGTGGTSSGSTSYADGRKSIITGITIGNLSAFNGAFPFNSFNSYNSDDYILDAVGKKLLTTLPETVRISRKKSTWLSGFIPSGAVHYVVFDILGVLYRYPMTTGTNEILMFDALPSDDNILQTWNGTAWVGFLGGLDLTGVETYSVSVQTDTLKSETKTLYLYNECDYHTTYDITFLDRLGSWITIPFYKGSYMNQEITREMYRKKYGVLYGGNWEYQLNDKGISTYNVEEKITYTVNSGFLSEIEAQYIRELMTTPQAFVSINGGEQQSIVIDNNSQALNLQRTQRDRKVSLNFKMAVQDETNQ